MGVLNTSNTCLEGMRALSLLCMKVPGVNNVPYWCVVFYCLLFMRPSFCSFPLTTTAFFMHLTFKQFLYCCHVGGKCACFWGIVVAFVKAAQIWSSSSHTTTFLLFSTDVFFLLAILLHWDENFRYCEFVSRKFWLLESKKRLYRQLFVEWGWLSAPSIFHNDWLPK